MKNLSIKNYENGLSFKLYDTVILTKTAESVILSYGEFKTKTTFKAINQILNDLNVPLKVYVYKGQALIENIQDTLIYDFKNGIEFDLSGQALEAVTV